MTNKPPPLTLSAVYRSASFYPVTILYLGGVLIAAAISQGVFDVATGIIISAVLAVAVLVLATLRELRTVHRLVDGQRSELVARIDDLSALLVHHDVPIPPQGASEADAREEVREEQERDANG